MNSKKYGHLKENGVSIARGNKYWDGPTYPALFPTWDIIKRAHDKTITKEDYETIYYKEVLSNLDPSTVASDLENKILLCYETIADIETGKAFCHRHMVAEWLKQNGFEVEELR